MSIGQIIKSWVLTIVIGSILSLILYIPVVLAIKEEGWKFITGFFIPWLYITAIMSIIFSIPTILILIAVNQKLLKKGVTRESFDRNLTLTQLICGMITFALLIFQFKFDGWEYLIVCAVAFIGTGLMIWKKELKKISPTFQKKGAD